jgi:hypothetical protein
MLCRAIRHYAKNLRQRLVVLYLFEAGQNNKEDTAFGELQFRPFLEGLSTQAFSVHRHRFRPQKLTPGFEA